MPQGSRTRSARSRNGPFNPFDREFAGSKEVFGLVEVQVLKDLEANNVYAGLGSLAQRDAMMTALLHRAQIESPGFLVRYLQPQGVHVKCPARGQILHGAFDVAYPNDVEGGIENWLRHRHGHPSLQVSVSAPSLGIGCSPSANPMCFCSM